ncbi:hypothetical protein OI18_17485 [Flavihumibacter solisilvae]|uniref:Uncharacterized protein n=1 Tax=Flavihumibacter solisilvae TaxID=1349421 RepID=A0A0C1IT01_9BACT|nr:hypothetical protein OI18_17485 [Flavihumibacter solisilvae]
MNNAFTLMSMLPEFKLREGTPRLVVLLTAALNCESIRPLDRQVSDFFLPGHGRSEITVAQQSVICTRFLFKHHQ